MRKYLSKLRQWLKANNTEDIYTVYSYSQALLYLTDMVKDALDTFTPYKTTRHRRRDLLQGVYGLKNTLSGIFFGIMASLLFVAKFCFDTLPSLFAREPRVFFSGLKTIFYELTGDLLGASTQTLRGVTQIVTWPLSLLRSTWRSFLSRNREWEKFQDRKSVISLVNKADSVMELNNDGSVGHMRKVLVTLTRKANSNIEKKQDSGKVNIPVRVLNLGVFYVRPREAMVTDYIMKDRKDDDQLSSGEIRDISRYIKNFRNNF